MMEKELRLLALVGAGNVIGPLNRQCGGKPRRMVSVVRRTNLKGKEDAKM